VCPFLHANERATGDFDGVQTARDVADDEKVALMADVAARHWILALVDTEDSLRALAELRKAREENLSAVLLEEYKLICTSSNSSGAADGHVDEGGARVLRIIARGRNERAHPYTNDHTIPTD